MKTLKFLGLELKFSFSLRRVKRIEVPIPDWAVDCHLNLSDRKVVYWIGPERFFIEIPSYKEAKEVSLTPLYNRKPGERFTYSTNRKIVIDLYL